MTVLKLLDAFNDKADLRTHPFHALWNMERFFVEELESAVCWHNHFLKKTGQFPAMLASEERFVVRTLNKILEFRAKHPELEPESKLKTLYGITDNMTQEDLRDGRKVIDAIRPLIRRQEPGPNPLTRRPPAAP